jgi:hypothetical protein
MNITPSADVSQTEHPRSLPLPNTGEFTPSNDEPRTTSLAAIEPLVTRDACNNRIGMSFGFRGLTESPVVKIELFLDIKKILNDRSLLA